MAVLVFDRGCRVSGLREIANPFVAAAPAGARVRIRLRVNPEEAAVLKARLADAERRIATGRVSVCRGGRRLARTRHNLAAAGLTGAQWRRRWEAGRLFLTADGEAGKAWGNEIIRWNPDAGWLEVRLPAPLAHLGNAPHGRYRLSCPVQFAYRGDEVAAQAATGAVRYDISLDPVKGRWYIDASWRTAPAAAPSLDELRQVPLLAVDLNHGHLAAWVITPDGNPLGDPVTVPLELAGLRAPRRDGRLRAAISMLIRTAREHGCRAIAVENLDFAEARAEGRERAGNGPSRGKRGRGFRRIVAGIPTARFRGRLAQMAHNRGLAVIAVDPAYTSQWAAEHWLAPLRDNNQVITGHHAAAVVIGRRAHGHRARRRAGVIGPDQRIRTWRTAPRAPAARRAPRNGGPRQAPRQPPRWPKTATATRDHPPDQAAHDRSGPPDGQDHLLLSRLGTVTVVNMVVGARRSAERRHGVAPLVSGRLPAVFALAVILAGAAQRWWVAAHPIGTLTSDGGVIGLMAQQLLHHGQLTAYMWGQAYGGSIEAVSTAAVFTVAGAGTSQLIATTALSSALCALALWRTGRRIVGEPAALIGALVFWVWPASFLWRSLKPGGTYMAGLAIALCAVGALARIRQGDDGWRRCAVAGVWCGLAVWSNPMSLQLLLPAALWCLPAIRRIGRRLLGLVAGAVVGGSPALVFGVTHDWANLRVPGYRTDLLTGIPDRLREFFTTEGPIAMGVRVEGSFAWVGGRFGEILAMAAAAALLVTASLVVAGRARRCRLPMLTLALLPLLYALNPLADRAGQGRYALFAVPMGALLIGVGIEHAAALANRAPAEWRAPAAVYAAGLLLACALGTAGLLSEPGQSLVAFPAPDVAMPANDSALLRLLAERHVADAYAPYWIAYRVMFETGGQTEVTPDDYDRYPPIAAAVAASPDPAYLFVAASRTVASFEMWCRDHDVGYQSWQLAGFTIIQPLARGVAEP